MMDLDLDFVLCCYTEVEEEQVVVHDWNVPQNEIRCFDWDPLFPSQEETKFKYLHRCASV